MKIKLFQTELANQACGLEEGMIVEAEIVTPERMARDALGDMYDSFDDEMKANTLQVIIDNMPQGMVVFKAPGNGEELIVTPEVYQIVEE